MRLLVVAGCRVEVAARADLLRLRSTRTRSPARGARAGRAQCSRVRLPGLDWIVTDPPDAAPRCARRGTCWASIATTDTRRRSPREPATCRSVLHLVGLPETSVKLRSQRFRRPLRIAITIPVISLMVRVCAASRALLRRLPEVEVVDLPTPTGLRQRRRFTTSPIRDGRAAACAQARCDRTGSPDVVVASNPAACSHGARAGRGGSRRAWFTSSRCSDRRGRHRERNLLPRPPAANATTHELRARTHEFRDIFTPRRRRAVIARSISPAARATLGAAAWTRFAEDVGGIQLDSIKRGDAPTILTVWSRFGPYDRKAFERLAYRRRLMFEYWAHAACLVPIAHFPAWRRAMHDYSTRSRGWSAWLKKNRSVLRTVEQAIQERGALGNADFARPPLPPGKQAGWWNWKPAQHALDYCGEWSTTVHSRVHFTKRFDLAERVLPQVLATEPLARLDFLQWHVRRSLHAMGAATWADLRGYLSFPAHDHRRAPAGPGSTLEDRRRRRSTVAGAAGKGYALATDLDALAKQVGSARRRAAAPCWRPSIPFSGTAPARPPVGFDYRMRSTRPVQAHARSTRCRLHNGQIIGRVDPRPTARRGGSRRATFTLSAGSWPAARRPLRAGGASTARPAPGNRGALRSLAAFVGADRITLGRVNPGSHDGAVRRALATEPSRRSLRHAFFRRRDRGIRWRLEAQPSRQLGVKPDQRVALVGLDDAGSCAS